MSSLDYGHWEGHGSNERWIDDLTCAPAIHPDFRMVGSRVGELCPFCHHTNVVHDTHRNVCVLCDLQGLARELAP